MSIGVAIIGAGRIGYKRAQALRKFKNCRLQVIVDVNRTSAENLSKEFGREVETR